MQEADDGENGDQLTTKPINEFFFFLSLNSVLSRVSDRVLY